MSQVLYLGAFERWLCWQRPSPLHHLAEALCRRPTARHGKVHRLGPILGVSPKCWASLSVRFCPNSVSTPVWSYRWPIEIFHEFGKQVVGLEASQVRKEEAVKRHFRLSCVAQSLLQRLPAGGTKSERFSFAEDDQPTVGQKLHTLTRDALGQLLQWVQGLLVQGQSQEQDLERLMSSTAAGSAACGAGRT